MKKLVDIKKDYVDIQYSESLSLTDLLRVLVNDYNYAKKESHKLYRAALEHPEILNQYHNTIRKSLDQFELFLGPSNLTAYEILKRKIENYNGIYSLDEYKEYLKQVKHLIKEFASKRRLDIQGWIYFDVQKLYYNDEYISFDLNNKQLYLLTILFSYRIGRVLSVVIVADKMAKQAGEHDDFRGEFENSMKRASEEINAKFQTICPSKSKLIIRNRDSIYLNKNLFHPVLTI